MPWWKRPGVLATTVGISLALILMAVIIIKVKVPTPNEHTGKVIGAKGGNNESKPPRAEATVVLEIDQPGAEVSVDEQNIKVNVPGDNEPIEIKVEPGQRKLRISKAGFVAVTQDIELKTGESRSIKIRLVHEPPKSGDKGDEKWFQEVAGLPAKAQVKAVAAKLKERNPGFDGEVKPTYENEVVTGLEFVTDYVREIRPLRALTGLKRLSCSGSGDQKGKLANLSPLKGMHLTDLNCQFNKGVSDLSPLKDMKLRWLCCIGTSVSDLSPLKGMPLNGLACWGTTISDLSPLKDMPLETLLCGISKVSDLSPLKDMSLRVLGCGSTQVSDLSPVKDMRLNCLICFGTAIKDLSPLRGMPLAELHCQNTRVSDLSPLKDMPLKTLECDFRPERDAGILRSIKSLEKINDKPVDQFWKEVDEQNRKPIAPLVAEKPQVNLPAKPAVPSLVKMLDSGERWSIRQSAVEALIELGYPTNESAHRTLLKIVEKDSNTNLRCLCVIALAPGIRMANFRKLGWDKVLTKLLDEKGREIAPLRYNAAHRLALFLQDEAPPKTVEVLLEWLRNKDGTAYKVGGSTCFAAAEALAWLGDKAAKRRDVARALREAAKDEDEKLRAAARKAMNDLNIKE